MQVSGNIHVYIYSPLCKYLHLLSTREQRAKLTQILRQYNHTQLTPNAQRVIQCSKLQKHSLNHYIVVTMLHKFNNLLSVYYFATKKCDKTATSTCTSSSLSLSSLRDQVESERAAFCGDCHDLVPLDPLMQ